MKKMIRIFLITTAITVILAAQSSALNSHRLLRNVDPCGIPKSEVGLIVHGQSFPRGSYPWIVALMNTQWNPPKFFCAGTLISKMFVVSAAHCIHQKHVTKKFLPRDILALFGAHNLSNSFETGRYVLSPKEIYIHDKWNPWTNQYEADLSMLEFETGSIHFNDFVLPICLWDSEVDPIATEGIVTGWGKSEDITRAHENLPKLIKAPMQANEECLPGQKEIADISSKTTFCAGLKNGSGVCTGDSGGGLFIKVNDVYYLKGIVSASLVKDDGCDVSKNAVYTNVLKFKDWIKDITDATSTKKVFCTFEIISLFSRNGWPLLTSKCGVDQSIDSEDYVLGLSKNTSTESFVMSSGRGKKYLPRDIGEKFPNLKEFSALMCGLTVVREFYLKKLGKLQYLYLSSNKISTIEARAFDDLVSLVTLYLPLNLIETLDEKLFNSMVNLEEIVLYSNKIKFLSPATFIIPGNRKLKLLDLENNVCIDKEYKYYDLRQAEQDIRTNCTQ